MYMYIYMYIYTYTCICVSFDSYIYTHSYRYLVIRIYTCICICIHIIYIYIYIYIYHVIRHTQISTATYVNQKRPTEPLLETQSVFSKESYKFLQIRFQIQIRIRFQNLQPSLTLGRQNTQEKKTTKKTYKRDLHASRMRRSLL